MGPGRRGGQGLHVPDDSVGRGDALPEVVTHHLPQRGDVGVVPGARSELLGGGGDLEKRGEGQGGDHAG